MLQIYFTESGKRIFTVVVENQVFEDIDLIPVGGFATAFTIELAKIVDDGFVSIQTIDRINKAKLSGIEIILKEVHTAHAVSQGPVSSICLLKVQATTEYRSVSFFEFYNFIAVHSC